MFHKSVISLRKALGYHDTDEGCCRGVTMRWLEACILNEEDIFDKRIRKINALGNSLVQSIDNAKQKVRDKKELTQEELDFLDILVFYESLELYHAPYKFSAIFNNKYYTQNNIDPISSIAASDQIKDRGGLTTVYSESGIYTIDEISTYLDELATAIQKSGCSSKDILGIVLKNVNHIIGLTYQSQVGWKVMDINQYPSMTSERTQDVAEKIAKGFKDSANTSPWFAFNTSVIVTGNHTKRDQFVEQLNAVKNSHVITDAIAQREEIINLAWIAAQHGEADVIMSLWKSGANLGKVDKDGVTPAYLAAQLGHAQIITILVEAHADLDMARNGGATPAFVSAHYGHANVITVLGEAHADLDKAMNNSATPAFIAAQNSHTNVITALLAYNANMDIPFISSAENLRLFASKRGESVISRMNIIIQNQLNAGKNAESIAIKPRDIAWIMGHDAIVNLLREKLEVTTSGMFAADHSRKPATDMAEEKGSKKDIGFKK